jgi:hypothetical protein
MRRIQQPLQLIITATALCFLVSAGQLTAAQADPVITPSLVISQLKITSSNGQFITLYNPTNTALDMSKYQLEYFNSYDLSKATSSKLIALSGTVPPHGYFMVNDSALLLCYQLTIDSVSLGLSSTAGFVEVLAFNQTAPGSSVTPVLQDYVGWSKTASGGAQTLPASTNAFLQRLPVDNKNNPLVSSPGVGSWQSVQPDAGNACNLVGAGSSGSSPVQTGLNQLLPATEPPVTIISLADDSSSSDTPTPVLPTGDIGLKAPEITEILPNPNGTGNDGTDEFIELYNSNNISFDLSGFSLQTGTTSLHNFTFLPGTSLPAQSFTTFSSSVTGLSLSNSGGQVKLLDPFGNSISATDVYSTAKDGETWALANGKWYWTTSATPGAANVIKQPISAKAAKAAAKAKAAKSGAVKAAKTAKGSKSKVVSGSLNPTAATTTPIHLWTLALVAGLALLYATYEYRADLANRLYQFRKYLGSRRSARE